MRKFALIALLAATASPALAQTITLDEGITMSSVLGTTMQEVRASVTAMGYDVRKSEMERGLIEVYLVRGNERGEVYVDAQTGAVTKIKMR